MAKGRLENNRRGNCSVVRDCIKAGRLRLCLARLVFVEGLLRYAAYQGAFPGKAPQCACNVCAPGTIANWSSGSPCPAGVRMLFVICATTKRCKGLALTDA
jgi:hypothetical protein